MTTRLCDCVYAKARKLYDKFHESRGEVPVDFDSLADDEREVWAKTVAGKGNYVVDDKPKRKPRAKPSKETAMLISTDEPPKTSYVEPDWKEREREQRRTLAKLEREENAAKKAAEREAAKGKRKTLAAQ